VSFSFSSCSHSLFSLATDILSQRTVAVTSVFYHWCGGWGRADSGGGPFSAKSRKEDSEGTGDYDNRNNRNNRNNRIIINNNNNNNSSSYSNGGVSVGVSEWVLGGLAVRALSNSGNLGRRPLVLFHRGYVSRSVMIT
jgi:hypothetical protein